MSDETTVKELAARTDLRLQALESLVVDLLARLKQYEPEAFVLLEELPGRRIYAGRIGAIGSGSQRRRRALLNLAARLDQD